MGECMHDFHSSGAYFRAIYIILTAVQSHHSFTDEKKNIFALARPKQKDPCAMNASFEMLGLNSDSATEQDVLRAWRRLARENHPDKTAPNDTRMKELNEAKEACLQAVIRRTCAVDEREFVLHIARSLEKSIRENAGIDLDLQDGTFIQPYLRKHMWVKSVDAMQWVLRCAIGEWDFNQAIDDEIPILCRYHNDFLGADEWTEDDHTMMTVLNRYDEIKAKGYGNFARFLQNTEEQT